MAKHPFLTFGTFSELGFQYSHSPSTNYTVLPPLTPERVPKIQLFHLLTFGLVYFGFSEKRLFKFPTLYSVSWSIYSCHRHNCILTLNSGCGSSQSQPIVLQLAGFIRLVISSNKVQFDLFLLCWPVCLYF